MNIPNEEHWIWGVLGLVALSATMIVVFLFIVKRIKIP